MALGEEHRLDGFLVRETGVIGAEGKLHWRRYLIIGTMRNTAKFLVAGAFALASAASALYVSETSLHAQARQAQPAAAPQQDQPTFRATAELVTTDVIVRDPKNDQFMADLKPTDFEVYEDGVKQELASM